jgi:recombination associated protein RdgC
VGFLQPSSTVVRFIAPPPARLDREAFADAVARRTFREIEAGLAGNKQAFGWVGIHDPLAIALSTADLFFQQYLVVGFRFDKWAIPAKLLWLERRRVEEQRKAERGVPRLGAATRREIKEEIEARLMLRALPTPSLFDCAWNLETGRVFFSGKQKAARDCFVDLFRETFGITPMPLIPYLAAEYVGLSAQAVEAVRAVEPANLVPAAQEPAHAGVPHLGLVQPEASA